MTVQAKYYDYEEMTAALKEMHQNHPNFTRLSSLGKTEQGREIWFLTIGENPDEKRPALCVDANMHAGELVGTTLILNFAKSLLCALSEARFPKDLPEGFKQHLENGLIYLIPRSSPDGAESILKQGGFVRSKPAKKKETSLPHWTLKDVDGDGQIRVMRRKSRSGQWVELPGAEKSVLTKRKLGDTGPFYDVFREGEIENFDGHHVPSQKKELWGLDLNRNYPSGWEGHSKQLGGGDVPLESIESKAMSSFIVAHPNISFWINMHTFGGVVLMPPMNSPENHLAPDEIELWKTIRELSEEHLSYPAVAVSSEFTYDERRPITGSFMEFLLKERGIPSVVIEVWAPWREAKLDLPKPSKYFGWYSELPRKEFLKFVEWDKQENEGLMFQGWKDFEHKQLGSVEIGGLHPAFGLWNPSQNRLSEIVEDHIQFYWAALALRPQIEITDVIVKPIAEQGDGKDAHASKVPSKLHEISWRVSSTGFFPSDILSSVSALGINAGLVARVQPADGSKVQVIGKTTNPLGHLNGVMRHTVDFLDLALSGHAADKQTVSLSTVVSGQGAVELVVHSERFGEVKHRVAL